MVQPEKCLLKKSQMCPISLKHNTKPYTYDIGSEEVDREFLKNLKEIRDVKLEGAKKLAKQIISGNNITNRMRAIRNTSFEERKFFYNNERVNNQQEWYSRKAKMNENSRVFWFWGALVIEVIAVTLAFLLISNTPCNINPVAILISTVAVILAWNEIKKHRELSQSYTLVVQELAKISSMYVHINTEENLSDYVEEIENVISKEHILWLAKREK